MKNLLQVIVVIACSALAVMAIPVPEPNPDPAPAPAPEPKTDIELMKIPLEGDQELDVITLVSSDDQKINERNKRTIGILRELFPTISQILDQKIQMITSYLFRTLGPILLRSGLGGGAGGNAGGRDSKDDDFDADFDDDDDDDKATDSEKSDSGSNGSDGGSKVSISLPTFPPSDDNDDGEKTTATSSSTSDENEIRKRAAARLVSTPSSSLSGTDPTTTALSADTAAPSTDTNTGSSNSAEQDSATTTQNAQISTDSNLITSNQDMNTLESLDLAGLSDTLNAIRRARATDQDVKTVEGNDEPSDASAKSSALDELSLDSEGNDEDRNKRFLFGGSSGGSGGSGNFLFDIIRLVSGSSGTEQSDEKANSPDDDHELGKGDGYTEGIPGPVTRLFVLANRGLSNLIQDLILRIAQTSERVVNFKARLITSLI
ncbi:dentin sialophosphoprotein isoform X2 [Armigeres subalbatus]|uniref:dentin sialophosphoprotein isoform X2 n=1 Tax=Armigeres subalbatus TaxID=124917 RepID=UPI002ED58217